MIGAWQGFWIAFVEMPAFVVTLAGMLLFRGLTPVLLTGGTISGLPPPFTAIGAAWLPPDDGTPIILIIRAVRILVHTFVLNRTLFCRHIYAGLRQHRGTFGTDKWKFTHFVLTPDISAAKRFPPIAAVQWRMGTIVGAVIGGLVMAVLNMALSILSVDAAWKMAIKGLVLLLAVAFDIFNKRRSGGR